MSTEYAYETFLLRTCWCRLVRIRMLLALRFKSLLRFRCIRISELLILCHRSCALHPCDAAADKLCPTENHACSTTSGSRSIFTARSECPAASPSFPAMLRRGQDCSPSESGRAFLFTPQSILCRPLASPESRGQQITKESARGNLQP